MIYWQKGAARTMQSLHLPFPSRNRIKIWHQHCLYSKDDDTGNTLVISQSVYWIQTQCRGNKCNSDIQAVMKKYN